MNVMENFEEENDIFILCFNKITLATLLRRDCQYANDRNREDKQEAIVKIRVKDNGILDWGSGNGMREISNSRNILKEDRILKVKDSKITIMYQRLLL